MQVIQQLLLVILYSLPTPSSSPTQTANLRPKMGINVGLHTYYSGDLAFVDVMKGAQFPWLSQNADGSGAWDNGITIPVNANGYPLEIPHPSNPPQIAHGLLLRNLSAGANQNYFYPAGTYSLVLEGNGEVVLGYDAGNIKYTAPGTYSVNVANPSDQGIWVKITRSDKNKPITKIQLLLPGFTPQSALIYNPSFVQQLAGMQAIRFMTWTETQLRNSQGGYISQLDWPQLPTRNFVSYVGPTGGVPPDIISELCNSVGADPWINIPYAATDNFVQNYAQALLNALDPALKVYVAYSNEIWNSVFLQYQYARDQGCALNLVNNCYDGVNDGSDQFEAALAFQVKRSAEIFAIFQQVLGANRVIRVIEGQAANAWTSENYLLLKFLDNKIVNNGQFPDAIAIAPYAGGSIGDRPDIFSLTVPDIFNLLYSALITETETWTAAQRAVADQYGTSLIAYEAGQHLVSNVYPNDSNVTNLLIGANRDPAMEAFYYAYDETWRAQGGELMCYYHFVDESPSKIGSWGALESLLQSDKEAPKYRALTNLANHIDSSVHSYGFSTADCQNYDPQISWHGDTNPGDLFTTTIDGARPNAIGVLFLGIDLNASGALLGGVTSFIDFNQFVLPLPISMDANGHWEKSIFAPKFHGLRWYEQALLVNANCASKRLAATAMLDVSIR